MKRRGFSMIELIVVMGILSLLASLLFPMLVAAKSKAGETACISNLRQIGTAMLMYKDEEGEFPWGNLALANKLGPAKLRCPQKLGKYAYNLSVYESNAAFAMPVLKGDKLGLRYAEAARECMERRGPQFPLVIDMNHLPKILRAKDDRLPGTALVFRLSGADERAPGSRVAEINLDRAGVQAAKNLLCSSDAQMGNL